MTFDELLAQIDASGWTRTPNRLDDLLLRELPPDYYCCWRFIWRKTIGWGITEDNLSLRTIAEGANIPKNTVSRAAHFFHVICLIRYTPGKKNQDCSLFEILPYGLLEAEEVKKRLRILASVLQEEKELRRQQHKDFRFNNDEFIQKCVQTWEKKYGPVVQPAPAAA